MASSAPPTPVAKADPARRFAIAVSRFNAHITDGLLNGARACLAEAAVTDAQVTVVQVPGAFELPLVAQRLARSGAYDAVVCLGCLIKGDTMHFEYIAHACTTGLAQVALDTGIPVAFGVLTTLDEAQAVARAGEGRENKGWEATQAALEMVAVLARLDAVSE